MMDFHFNLETFTVDTFYSYPTSVIYRISEYTDGGYFGTRGDKKVKQFFDDVLTYAENKLGRKLMDNKIAFKVTYKSNSMSFYVGYKDNTWAIGLDLNPHMNSCKIINLK